MQEEFLHLPRKKEERDKLIAQILDTLGCVTAAYNVREYGYSPTSLVRVDGDARHFVAELASDPRELLRCASLSRSQLDEFIGVDAHKYKEPFNYFFGKVLHTLLYQDLARHVWGKKESIFFATRRYSSVENYLQEHYGSIKPHHRKMLVDAMDIGGHPSVDDGEETGGTLRIHLLSRMTRSDLELLSEPYKPNRTRDERDMPTHRVRGLGHF